MIRYRLAELMADKRFKDGERVTLEDIAQATGIHRATLSKILNQRGYNTTVEVVGKICRYFGVPIGDLIEDVPDTPKKKPAKKK